MSLADIVAHVEAAGVVRVYEENAVEKKPDYPYVVLGLSFAAPGVATMDGHRSTPQWLTAKVYSRSDAALEATTTLVDAALNGRALPLPDSPVAEFIQANQMSRDNDDSGVLGTVLAYRY